MQQTDSLPAPTIEAGETAICWSLRSGDIRSIRLNLRLLDSLRQEIAQDPQSRENEIGGLLFGTIEQGQFGAAPELQVSLSHPMSLRLLELDEARLLDSIPEWIQYSRWSPVGFYRTHRRPGLQLDAKDRSLADHSLAARVILLIDPTSDDEPIGSLFIRGEDNSFGSPVPSFPLSSQGLAKGRIKPERPEDLDGYSQFPSPGPGNVNVAVPAIPGAGLPRLYWWIIAAGAALILFFVLYAPTIRTGRGAVRPAPVALPPVKATGDLGLKASIESDHLRVNWGPNVPPSDSGATGVLVVKDGLFRNFIPLDASVLQKKTVTYFPVTASVEFELQIGGVTDSAAISGIPEAARLPPDQPTVPPGPLALQPSAPRTPAAQPAVANLEPTGTQARATKQPLAAPKTRPLRPETTQVSELLPPPTLNAVPNQGSGPLQQLAVPAISAKSALRTDQERIVYLAPQSLKRVAPKAPADVNRLLVSPVTIRVKVTIDAKGNVVRAESLSRGSALMNYLSTLSVDAARKWVFRPAQEGSRVVESETVVEFSFEPRG